MIDQKKVEYDINVVRDIADRIVYLNKERSIAIIKIDHETRGDLYNSLDITIKSSKTSVTFNYYAILGFCLWHHTNKVLMIHNHPNEYCIASEDDVWEACDLRKELKEFNVTLLDSVIVTKDDMWSIAEHNWKFIKP